MEAKKAHKVFRYQSDVRWEAGRRAVVRSSGNPDLHVSSPPEFKGDPGIWTPEDLFVTSVNVCTLMTFVATARHKGLELLGYESAAEGVLENVEGKYRFTKINLRPQVTVKSQLDVERAREIVESAHANCFISNSISVAVRVSPEFRVA
jgi:organic hydroperoxide reductase OsmC/OhrA